MEEQVGGLGFELDVADFVDDDQRVAPESDEFLLEPAGVVGFGQSGDPFGRRWRTGRGARPDTPGWRCRWPDGSCRCPAGRGTPRCLWRRRSPRCPRWAMVSRLRPRAWSKSNSSKDFRDGNRAARMRPSPPWDSRAETSRCRHATRNSSWVQDSERARSASRATASRMVGVFRARVRKPISAVRSRWLEDAAAVLAVVLVVMTPTRLRRGRSRGRCRSRLSARCSTVICSSCSRTGRRAPILLRRSMFAAARCSGSVMV